MVALEKIGEKEKMTDFLVYFLTIWISATVGFLSCAILKVGDRDDEFED